MNYLKYAIQNHLKTLIRVWGKHVTSNGKRGHEVDLEYSKKEIMDKMNSFFGYSVVEKLKFISFDDDQIKLDKENNEENVTIKKYQNKINDVKNEKIKKSLIELTKVFKEK